MNVLFTKMYAKKGINLFGERDTAEIIKELKQLYEGEMPGNPVVIPLNHDKIEYSEMRQSL